MRLLGVILAGGRSSRFGSDKALARLHGQPLIAHVAAALAAETPHLRITGRSWPGCERLDDLPHPGLGPLGGLAAALAHARARCFDAVLAAPCDMPRLPHGLAALLAPAPAVALGQPVLGLWPAALADALVGHLTGGNRALLGWVAAAGARTVDLGLLANVNTPGELAALARMPE